MKVKHWLEGQPLQFVLWDEGFAPDMYLTACGLTYISKKGQPKRWSSKPRQVTCKKCLAAYNFGQGNWRKRLK